MGSVKDLKITQTPSPGSPGRGYFSFSDRYSVFDWGEMPDLIPRKGEAIAVLSAYFFERLREKGVSTHYIGVVEGGETKKLDDLSSPANSMEVSILNVIRPSLVDGRYDYSAYKTAEGCFLIPLEVIYRNSLPAGSSVFKRLADGEITPADLGLEGEPSPNQKLSSPILDVSTKLEITDRYVKWAEASLMAGLSAGETEALKELALELDGMITAEFSRIGLVNEDGKFEFGFDPDRRPMLVDVFGTLDECRFTYNGIPVSKEIARIHYRDSEWHKAVEAAKKQDRQRWKEICAVGPDPLPEDLKRMISNAYCACTNEITGRKWFADAPSFSEVMKDLEKIN